MLPTYDQLRSHLSAIVKEKGRQGHVIEGLLERLQRMPDSYDRLYVGPLRAADPGAMAARVRAAFLGRVCGCVLGKPIEINADLGEVRAALEPVGE
jgi:hypothetical protein